MLLESLRDLHLDAPPGVPASPEQFRLNRCWPRSDSHLLLEYRSSQGDILAAQWKRSADGQSPSSADLSGQRDPWQDPIHRLNGQSLVLHRHGWDPSLPALQRLLRSNRAQLLGHRANKRAIVIWHGVHPPLYCKLFSSRRALRRSALGFTLAAQHADGFRTPHVQRVHRHACNLILTALSGTSLHDLITQGLAEQDSTRTIGRALRTLHGSTPDPALNWHRHEDEITVLQVWAHHLNSFLPQLAARIATHLDRTASALSRLGSDPPVIAHRDLHDKQILIAAGQPPGLLDFDTICLAHPCLDLANLLAHLELRHLQGRCHATACNALGQSVLDGYGNADRQALQAYLDSARLRLACVYAFRPQWHGVIDPLLERLSTPFGATV